MSQNRDNCAIYTPQQLREAEETAMGGYALPQVLLMEHAALAVADAICKDAGTVGAVEQEFGCNAHLILLILKSPAKVRKI